MKTRDLITESDKFIKYFEGIMEVFNFRNMIFTDRCPKVGMYVPIFNTCYKEFIEGENIE